MKKCSVCEIDKPLEDFYDRPRAKCGKSSYCKICDNIRSKSYRQKNNEAILANKREYYLKNRESILASTSTYRHKNKQKIRDGLRAYEKKRRDNDPEFRLVKNIRSRVGSAIRQGRANKVGSSIKELGCTTVELVLYIQGLWKPGMCWENYGLGIEKWNVDHVIPLTGNGIDLSNIEHFKIVCHYSNLKPEWHQDNVIKNNKSDYKFSTSASQTDKKAA